MLSSVRYFNPPEIVIRYSHIPLKITIRRYVHLTLMYTTDHKFPVLPIKDIINEDGDPTTPHKLAIGTKPSVSHLRVLFCPCVVRKATAHVETKTLNMRHQAQKGFRGIFVGIPQHQKGYLVYVPSTRNTFVKHNIIRQNYLSSTGYVHKISFLVLWNPNKDTAKPFLGLMMHV